MKHHKTECPSIKEFIEVSRDSDVIKITLLTDIPDWQVSFSKTLNDELHCILLYRSLKKQIAREIKKIKKEAYFEGYAVGSKIGRRKK